MLMAWLGLLWVGVENALGAAPGEMDSAANGPAGSSFSILLLAGAALLGGLLGMVIERTRRNHEPPDTAPKPDPLPPGNEQEKLLAGKLQMIRRIAHDFNNLLTGVVGHLTLIREDPALPAPFGRKLEEVESSAFKARDLTRQLLTLAREGSTP